MEARFGLIEVPRSIESAVANAKLAEKVGFDWLGMADSQSLFRELFVSLAMVGQATERLMIGPSVTNPLTRHPAVRGFDADPEPHAPVFRDLPIALDHAVLHDHGRLYRGNGTGEFDQNGVAGGADHTAAELLNCRIPKLAAMGLHRRQRAGLVRAHQAGIADHIGGDNRG